MERLRCDCPQGKFSFGQGSNILGCCTDLTAYKQLALSLRDRHCAVLSVYCPEKGSCSQYTGCPSVAGHNVHELL
eukprot:2429349-Amphidinium_carterae.1